ncbi:Glu/Leu/Phe/Val dehydrogenase dimerization domain-containing protein [Cyclobacterium jeungdonense]|uniref:Glu/Leu/Phe/Val dehydrogenase dimerization domain-containing protein n=1 Tax=Cyclobacterium jeungdonense TaxID=708087 RepID=A0ABT8C684_9BACT|nr:Glu/Leu/Phe/Val dehydrogenase dimerization domain-containing protein [Cyclobacterium jeungdonense]MDN3687995.1 Glu/Leu/Phe/Val dehydrogenase dimerization domain-containing protein [Cyclobacterium jeungdonense]
MRELLKKFENRQPEIVFEWSDSETEAEGWLVIDSLRGGAAGGDTRMKKGLEKKEVIQLAKNTAIKYTISGPPIGGAKAGINFDPHDPRKDAVLDRWFKVVSPILKSYFGTSAGIHIHENKELIPHTENYGLWHPQEGVVNGHYKSKEPQKIRKIGQLRQGLAKIIENPDYYPAGASKYRVSDMITGFGLAAAVKHYYKLWGGSPKGKKAIIQGWGNVGAAAAYFLAKEGVQIVGILSLEGAIIDQNGLNESDITQLFLSKEKNKLASEKRIPFEEGNEKIWNLSADLFIPAAKSRLVDKEKLEKLMAGGVKLIVSGANFPFAENDIFMGPVSTLADDNLSLIPDFIANVGISRLAAYLMSEKVVFTDEALFQDVSQTIYKALKKCHQMHPEKNQIAQTGLEIALEQLA